MYLIDTVVLSELFKRHRHPGLVHWFADKPEDVLFLSVVTVGEIERGIERQRRRDPPFAEALRAWLDRSIVLYGNRILPVTTSIARVWGQLTGRLGHDNADLLIAATALDRGFAVVTRNVRHFAPTGVAVENPFTESD